MLRTSGIAASIHYLKLLGFISDIVAKFMEQPLNTTEDEIQGQGQSDEPPPKKGSKYSWFAHLNKNSTKFMHQLLNTTEDETQGQASMKWDHFVQMMEGMGFTWALCGGGTRVRFDPPNDKDPSVVFHKPHPENFIYPIKLKEYSKTLRSMYGWTSDDFMKASAFGK